MTWLVAAAVLAAGCGAGEAAEPQRGGVAGAETTRTQAVSAKASPSGFATPAELRWLRALARWNRALFEAVAAVAELEEDPERFDRVLSGEPDARAEYERLLGPVRDCGRSFERTVPAPPTERVASSAEGYRSACEHYRSAIELLLRGLDEEDDGLVQRAQYQVVDARKQMQVADGTLPPGEKQELPVREGEAGVSRVEPRFGAAATEAVGKEVEARCWSSRDWRRLMVEEAIHTDGKIDAEVLGFAAAGGARINLAPLVCDQLVRLVYEGARPERAEGRLELALGLVTLVHEAVHASGVADEAAAECHAIQLADEAGAALGLDEGYVAGLKAAYWETYPSLPAVYRSEECRAGGELDLGDGEDFP